MSQSSNAKKARREINKHAEKIEQAVALDIIEGMYRMPFWKRAKWSWKILCGTPRDYDHCALVWVWRADYALEALLFLLDTPVFTRKKADANVKK